MELFGSIYIWGVRDELALMLDRVWVRLCFEVFLFYGTEEENKTTETEGKMYHRKRLRLMAWGNEGNMINSDPFLKTKKMRIRIM